MGWSRALALKGTVLDCVEEGLLTTDCQVAGFEGSTPVPHSKPPSGFSTPPLPKYMGDVGMYRVLRILTSTPRTIHPVPSQVTASGETVDVLAGGCETTRPQDRTVLTPPHPSANG